MSSERNFRDYLPEAADWITLLTGEYYPDILPEACRLYGPVLAEFGQLLRTAHSSVALLRAIMDTPDQWRRTQLCRIFRKYVSPETPVEMLKRKSGVAQVCERFGDGFRKVAEVQHQFNTRPIPDEPLCAVLWEYKDRGKKGYDLTERLFQVFEESLPEFEVSGPKRAGRDIPMGTVLADYPRPDRPIDFVIRKGKQVLAVGLARYDSDRGGSQEDDRPGQYRDVGQEVLGYALNHRLGKLKLIFVNDGPGLLLGTMWGDYAHIEELWPNRVRVVTLRMVPDRITATWLRS